MELFLALALLAFVLYYLGTRNHDYWAKRGVPCPRTKPLPFLGHVKDFLLAKVPITEIMRRRYRDQPDAPYVGILIGSKPALVLRDPELIRTVLSKDFEFFPNRPLSFDEKTDPLSANLVNLEGMRWKLLRAKLTPTFSSGKIKHMVPLMAECARELRGVLEGLAARGEAVEMKDLLSRFTVDVIGSCAFGVSCNALKDPHSEFHRQGAKLFEMNWRNRLRNTVMMAFPKVSWLHRLANDSGLTAFFVGIVRETIKHRQTTGVRRNDFMDLMIEIRNKGKLVNDTVDIIQDPFLKVPVLTSSEELKFTDNLMTAQAVVFFAAGFETSSTTMAFCLSELAHYPDIQDKIYAELEGALERHGDLTYEALAEMPYLDKVVSETLRMHPPLPRTARMSVKPYKMRHFVLESNTSVIIPIDAIHHDPAYYPEPERFDPERFSPEAVAARPAYTYLPFGEGPRICIGMRFALLQTKVGLASVLWQCRVEPSALSKYPIEYATGTFVTTSTDKCHVILRKRTPRNL